MAKPLHYPVDLDRVADAYNRARERGDAPRLAVAQTLGCSKSTADRHIRAARAVGLIGDYEPIGRPSGRMQRVAARLGVSEVALREAVLVEANGELRVSRQGGHL